MNAVIYARYSSDSQREESIEGQIRECTEYAKRNGITILGTYIDRALSARSARKTKYFNEIRRNNSKQSQYNVKFTENEKNMKKNLS